MPTYRVVNSDVKLRGVVYAEGSTVEATEAEAAGSAHLELISAGSGSSKKGKTEPTKTEPSNTDPDIKTPAQTSDDNQDDPKVGSSEPTK